jgi:pimeloyl-ACP methyl ester carboxylesterase
MTVSHTAGTTRTFDLGEGLVVTVDERGDAAASKGGAALVLHGGAGPRTVVGFAAALSEQRYVITPTHPGFDGTPRPDWTDTIADLALAYLDLLDELDLRDVVVFGNSIGGWIAAEMALRDNHGRVGGLVLLNAVGIRPDDPRDIVDTRTVAPADLGRLAFHNPAFRLDPSTLTDDQRAGMAANQQTLATYGGEAFLYDPKLRRRLHRVTVPALVVWGEQDGVASLRYGRAFAESFPRGRFRPIADAGHFPQIEQPGATMGAIGDFTEEVN